jgi:iron complex outermembrane receptor protein
METGNMQGMYSTRTKRPLAIGLLGLWIAFGWSTRATAQNQIMRGSIVGAITDAQQLAVPGASVEVLDVTRGRSWTLVSDAEGRYAEYGLDPGTYRVEARLSGFSNFSSNPLTLRAGQNLTLNIELSAAGIAEQISVTADVSERRTDYSSPANFITATQIASLNMPTSEDILNYQPGVVVRRRYIGDPNGTLGMRGANMFQTARALVYADGVPLNNPLQTRWDGAPRWSLVAPDEVESAEVIYGPFSAEYSGNAMGGVVKYKTKMPDRRQLHLEGNLFGQKYAFDGADNTLGGGRSTISYGDRVGRLSFDLLENHLQNSSQPMDFALNNSAPSVPSGQPVAMGAMRTVDYLNVPAILYGNSGKDQIRTDLFKIKIADQHTPEWSSRWTLAYENRHDQTFGAQNYLRDAQGRTIWGDGNNATNDAVFDGQAFNVDNSLFGVADRTRESLFAAWELHGEINHDWLVETTVSRFNVLHDAGVNSNFSPKDPLDNGSGILTAYHHTGWTTVDLKLRDPDFLSNPNLTFVTGYALSRNQLGVAQYSTLNDTRQTRDLQTSDSGGKTTTHAAFMQLGWRLHPDWELTLGGRQELWRTTDGFGKTTTLDLTHPNRSVSSFSPKASLGWEPADRLRVQYSIARAVRFPIVQELFDNEVNTYGTVLSDAGLDPEVGIHHNLSIQRGLSGGRVEMNVFRDNVDHTIFTQFQFVQGKAIYSFLPVDQVVTNGLEVTFDQRQMFNSPIDIEANTTITDATITRDALQPSLVGKVFPRMPKVRMGLFGIYHVNPSWMASLGARYVSNEFSDLNNDDYVKHVYGAIDPYLFIDVKLSYRLRSGDRLSFGVDNLTNKKAFVYHPWPARTFFAEFSIDVLGALSGRATK